jgi:hypothetical protein
MNKTEKTAFVKLLMRELTTNKHRDYKENQAVGKGLPMGFAYLLP